ncbi:MAG: carbonic anhydrase family protein [Verrucomicrobiota bacterium JB022]|nr:carbonic anhydrase family protein [Verrucomicrobiota bacterium JB022]
MKLFASLSFFAFAAALAANPASQDLPLSKEAQSHLTPDEVLADLLVGNAHFMENHLTPRDLPARRHACVNGQYPKAYILSCIDSRVPAEQVFDQALGDVFVGRVAGNVEGVDQLGSMEYAAVVAGVRVILVLGHESCGAVKGAIDHVQMGNLTALLHEIEPAVESVKAHHGDHAHADSHNHAFVDEVVAENVKRTVADIRQRSEALAQLEHDGRLRIIGAVYSLETGKVTLVQ